MLDVSHLNERGFWDIAAISTAPIVATHACAHAVCRSTRNLTDRQLNAIRDSGGVVGFNFSVCDVRPDAHLEPNTPIETVAQHLSYLVERMGEDHVALGSDFDGAVMPLPLRDASHLPNLIEALGRYGFNEATLRKIAFENWMRVFRESWR
jgi:membrane dipeptidase